MDEQRSRETRARAETALVRLRTRSGAGPERGRLARWRGPIERVPVGLELLCDLPDFSSGAYVSGLDSVGDWLAPSPAEKRSRCRSQK